MVGKLSLLPLLTSSELTKDELQLLSYGKQFALPPIDKLATLRATLVTDIAVGIKNDIRLNTEEVKNLINSLIQKLSSMKGNPDVNAFQKLRKRLKSEEISIVKSDKGNALILMSKKDYVEKISKFLKESKAVPISDFNGLLPNTKHAYPQYEPIEVRLNSFKNWQGAVPAESLANAGFFFSNRKDRTYCFHCGGGLESWDIDDNPLRAPKTWYLECKFIKRQKFTLDKYNTEVRKAISSSVFVIPVGKSEFLYQMSFSIPRLYGQLKLHKVGHPIRPVTAGYTCPSFKLGKFLARQFQLDTQFSPPHCIENSIQLADNLRGLRFSKNCRILLIDAKSMYTHIPIEKTIDIIYETLVRSQKSHGYAGEFSNLLLTCVQRNLCQFNGVTYIFPDG